MSKIILIVSELESSPLMTHTSKEKEKVSQTKDNEGKKKTD